MIKLLRILRLRKMVEKEARNPLDYSTIFMMNDQSFVDNVKKYNPDRYELIVKHIKRFHRDNMPECCLGCMAYYWKEDWPACTLGGEFTEIGQESRRICDNCILKEE